MSKVSSFYTKDSAVYEKKTCNFIIMKVTDGDYQKEVAQVEVDMAQYVNHTDSHVKIMFPTADYEGMFIDVIWTISPTDARGGSIMNS